MAPKFFRTRGEFRAWLAAHHARSRELVVGFHKKSSGVPSLSWPESVEEALCFGWIDGVRRRLDATRYTVRFSRRRAASAWSALNIRKARSLSTAGRMARAGRAAFAARRPEACGVYSYEQRPGRTHRALCRTAPARVALLSRADSLLSARGDLVGDQREAGADARAAPGAPHRAVA